LVDILRGIAMLLVVGVHVTTYSSDLLVITLMQTAIPMPLFFILSGFMIAYTAKLDFQWTIKRIVRVIVPFCVYGIMYQILCYSNDPGTYYINTLLSAGLSGGLWFFVTLAWCSLLLFVVSIFRRKGFGIMVLIFGGLIGMAAFVSYVLLQITGIYNCFGISHIVSYFPFVFIGYLLNIYRNNLSFLNKTYFLMPLSLIFPFFMLYCFYSHILTASLTQYWTFFDLNIVMQLGIRVIQFFLGVTFAYTIAKLLIQLPIINRILAWIGRNTIAIYGIQGLIIGWVVIANNVAAFPLYIIVVLMLCSLWAFLVNRFSFSRALFAGSWKDMVLCKNNIRLGIIK
jgi:hypothetical protein